MLTNDSLVEEKLHQHLGGLQRTYRVGNHGVSLVNGPSLHPYRFAWEAAVIRYMDGPVRCPEKDRWTLAYSTPLTNDVVVFRSDREANEFIQRAFKWFKRNPVPLKKYSVVKKMRTKERNRMRAMAKTLPGFFRILRATRELKP